MRIITSPFDLAAAQSEGLTVIAVPATITTQQAADLLNMSRPTLIARLKGGAIPFTTIGTHRRIALDDVLRYRTERSARVDGALSALAAEEPTE